MVDRCQFVEINSFAGVSGKKVELLAGVTGEEGTEVEFLDAVGKVKLRLRADVGRTKEFIADVTGQVTSWCWRCRNQVNGRCHWCRRLVT